MKRRIFLGALGAFAATGTALSQVPKRQHRLFNYLCSVSNGLNEYLLSGGRVFVDGKEIDSVWYVDTLSRVVQTLDIFLNKGEPIATVAPDWARYRLDENRNIVRILPRPSSPPSLLKRIDDVAEELGVTISKEDRAAIWDRDGVLSRTLIGEIELYDRYGNRLF